MRDLGTLGVSLSARDRYEERIYPGAYGGACVFILDTTARKKSEERLSLLAKISSILSGFIDHHVPSLIASILRIVEGTCSPQMGEGSRCSRIIRVFAGSVVAEWCILDMLEENGNLKRISTPRSTPDKWQVATCSPDSDGTQLAHMRLMMQVPFFISPHFDPKNSTSW